MVPLTQMEVADAHDCCSEQVDVTALAEELTGNDRVHAEHAHLRAGLVHVVGHAHMRADLVHNVIHEEGPRTVVNECMRRLSMTTLVDVLDLEKRRVLREHIELAEEGKTNDGIDHLRDVDKAADLIEGTTSSGSHVGMSLMVGVGMSLSQR